MPGKRIATDRAPGAVGPYSQAMELNVSGSTRFVYTAGQVAIDPAVSKLVEGDVAAQTKQALKNISAVLAAADMTTADVLKTTVFLVTMSDFKAMNEVYATFFADPPPARSTVAVKELPLGALVEIEVIAAR